MTKAEESLSWAQDQVRRLLAEMPGVKDHVQQVGSTHFPEAVREIKELRDKILNETNAQELNRLSHRYVYLWKTLGINVGLKLLGVSNALGFKKD